MYFVLSNYVDDNFTFLPLVSIDEYQKGLVCCLWRNRCLSPQPNDRAHHTRIARLILISTKIHLYAYVIPCLKESTTDIQIVQPYLVDFMQYVFPYK